MRGNLAHVPAFTCARIAPEGHVSAHQREGRETEQERDEERRDGERENVPVPG